MTIPDDSEVPDKPDNSDATPAQQAESESQGNIPRAHHRTIDGTDFWCEPCDDTTRCDPTSGRPYDDDEGNRYWCRPHENVFPPRKYDQRGCKDQTDID